MPDNFRVDWLSRGYTIHESICVPSVNIDRFNLLSKYSNYNITLSYFWFMRTQYSFLRQLPKSQIQVTVYNEDQAKLMEEYQKLYLIWNQETFDFFLKQINSMELKKIHFVIDQGWLNKWRLKDIIKFHNERKNLTHSVDSCLTNFIVNGRCVYQDDYIDISWDGSLRKCPFTVKGMRYPKGIDVSKLFEYKALPERCIYLEFFGGELNDRKYKATNVPNNPKYNRYGSNSTSERRLSLRSERNKPRRYEARA